MSGECDICGSYDHVESFHMKEKLEEVLFDLYTCRTSHPINIDEILERCEKDVNEVRKYFGEL